ncbi:energy transducer TonB [Bacteroides intestinalis]|nr:energy transducer TonB [Bacteroides intestinalis]RHI29866.1 energy transducer TonB [Bacteroides intestinalis]
MGEEKFTLTYNPSDRSLQVETEKSGSFHLFLDQRDLAQRLADWEALIAAIPPEAPSVPESKSQNTEEAEYDSQTEISEVPYIAPVEETNEREEAERARLQAELAAELQKEAEAEDPNKIYDNAEVMPEYPGGQVALMRYIAQNVKYPKSAQENGTQGKVVVQFVVDTDGSIINAYVLTSVDPDLDTEALRVIKSMPRWTPGKQKGKNVRVKYAVSVKFRLP